MNGITIKITGIQSEISRLQGYSKLIEKDVDTELQEGTLHWVGGLAQSIRSEKDGSMLYTVRVSKLYAVYMEFGTKGNYRPIPGTEAFAAQFKGKKLGTWKEFIKSIFNWVKRKGLAGTYSTGIKKSKGGGFEQGGSKGKRQGSRFTKFVEDYEVAFLIARSILKRGVKPQPYFFKHQGTVITGIEQQIKNRIASYD
jgi:hypothetical protein